MAKRQPAYRAFPPGDLIREEIEYRGWSQNDLAQIMDRPLQAVNELINGRKAITARTARELEAALGPDAQFWLNMETSYRLYKEAQADPEISTRARQIKSKVSAMVKPSAAKSIGSKVRFQMKPRDVDPLMRDDIVGCGGSGARGKVSPDRVRVKRVRVKKK
jgi:addiction module HigA family antidote